MLTSAGSAFFTAANPGTESDNVFHGFIATLPLDGARISEGCEVGEPVVPGCGNEEIRGLQHPGASRRAAVVHGGRRQRQLLRGHVCEGLLSWDQAMNAAAQARSFLGRPGRLVSITSAAENAFVESLRGPGQLRAWIGMRDPDGLGEQSSWTWTSGEPATYFNWSIGEPNNPTTEFWIEMFIGGQWNNNTVLDYIYPTLGYIVEYPPPPVIF